MSAPSAEHTPSISFDSDTKLTVKDNTATELLFWLRTCLRKPCGSAHVLPKENSQDAVVNATPRLLYPRERLGTHCTGGWVGPRAGLEGCGKSRPPPHAPTGIRSPDHTARSESLNLPSYPGPRIYVLRISKQPYSAQNLVTTKPVKNSTYLIIQLMML